METVNLKLNPAKLRYLLMLVSVDRERMRHLFEHAKSRGERGLMFPELAMAEDLSTDLLNVCSKRASAMGVSGRNEP